jgi:hypothetical protein|tara:strand:+ start:18933 stop:19121 length:189 start_codon:yes stop_codon:yes gene_type:complete
MTIDKVDVQASLDVVEKAVQELLDKENDLLRGGMIAGAMSNIKLALSMGQLYEDAVNKFLEK